MPRYRGVGMPRKRKTVKEPPSEAVDIPPERPDASERLSLLPRRRLTPNSQFVLDLQRRQE